MNAAQVMPRAERGEVRGLVATARRAPADVVHLEVPVARAARRRAAEAVARELPDPRPRYGQPVLVTPRLGQGSFRVLVTDAYERRCALTGEKVLPVLQAAHIRPYAEMGPHSVDNGLLLRSDLHTLFDQGYVTVTPDARLEVSRRIHDEFRNGRAYYAFRGEEVRLPSRENERPRREHLIWHNENVFRP